MKQTSRSASRFAALGMLAVAAVLTTAGAGLGACEQPLQAGGPSSKDSSLR